MSLKRLLGESFYKEHEYFEPIEADIRGFNNSKDKLQAEIYKTS